MNDLVLPLAALTAFALVFIGRKALPGSQFLLPLLLLTALAGAEYAARDGAFTPPPSASRPPDRPWRIDHDTDLLGNQSAKSVFEFAGREHRAKIDGPRVICLGTSSTIGHGLAPTEAPFPRVMESVLGNLCSDWKGDVVNAGMSGYHSFQLAVLQREVLVHLYPSVMIFYYGMNEGFGMQPILYYQRARALVDAHHELGPDERKEMLKYGTGNRYALGLMRLLSRSRLVEALRPRLEEVARKRRRIFLKPFGDEVPPAQQRSILHDICVEAKARACRLFLVPEISANGGPVKPYYARWMEEEADGKEVIYMDLSAVFPPPRARYFLDEVHMNAEGSAMLGEELARRVRTFICP